MLIDRFTEPAKPKKISFDDSSLVTCIDDKQNKSEDQVPSFATLPRKKKLSGNATSGTAQSAPQVTWMKEVAQKGVFLVILRDTTHLNNRTMTRL